jgi:hypothetical protein
MFEDKLIQAARSCELATTIRTRSETDSSVSMGGRNIARLLLVIFPGSDAFTILTPVIVVLVALAVHLMLASDKAEN